MHTFVTHSPEETKTLAKHVVSLLSKSDFTPGTATIIALRGNLGAGKTVFAKGVAEVLGLEEEVTSPTFVIQKTYRINSHPIWKYFVHIDAYRIESEDELYSIGWHDVATNPHNLILVEWPEQMGRGIPERAIWFDIDTVDTNTREFSTDHDIASSVDI